MIATQVGGVGQVLTVRRTRSDIFAEDTSPVTDAAANIVSPKWQLVSCNWHMEMASGQWQRSQANAAIVSAAHRLVSDARKMNTYSVPDHQVQPPNHFCRRPGRPSRRKSVV